MHYLASRPELVSPARMGRRIGYVQIGFIELGTELAFRLGPTEEERMSRFAPAGLTLIAAVSTLAPPPLAQAVNSPITPPAPAGHNQMAAPAAQSPTAGARLYDDLGSYHRRVTTRWGAAQRWFDQGLRLAYAFNLEEAERSFRRAAEIDPKCAMCFWGVSLALGPHINLAALPERTTAAHAAAVRAQALSRRASPVERALIAATVCRSADPAPSDPAGQTALDQAYADAMRGVRRRFPDDPDVAALTAEALMDLHPWDLWTADGQPKADTEEILGLLEWTLRHAPDHPGANHYYIHAVEASPHPEKALASAGRIAKLIPGAAHVVHMPSHIYARVGRWEEASAANRRAIVVDRGYLAQAGPLGFYPMYVAHNYQFLWPRRASAVPRPAW